jgi:uncharacterized phosphosugar-binding protein
MILPWSIHMNLANQYFDAIQSILKRISLEEEVSIAEAGLAMAKRLMRDRPIHVLGTGAHSFMGAEEMMYRSGGLVQVDAILDGGLSLTGGARRSTAIERIPQYMCSVLKTYDLQPEDVIIIVNAYGVNCATIDAAIYSHSIGLTVIGITSVEHARSLPADHPARHPSRKNLFEVADIVVDTKVPVGDAVLSIDGLRQKAGPVSTYANSFALNLISLSAIEECLANGYVPPIWQSGNSPGGDDANRENLSKYSQHIKHL